MIKSVILVLVLAAGAHAQTVGPNPQTFADAQATIAYLWQQVTLQQQTLQFIQSNRALQLGKFISFDFPRSYPTRPSSIFVIDVLSDGSQRLYENPTTTSTKP